MSVTASGQPVLSKFSWPLSRRDESCVSRWNMEMEGVMAPYKKIYKNLQKKTNQWMITFFFTWSSISPSILHCALFDDCDYLQTGTLDSLQSLLTWMFFLCSDLSSIFGPTIICYFITQLCSLSLSLYLSLFVPCSLLSGSSRFTLNTPTHYSNLLYNNSVCYTYSVYTEESHQFFHICSRSKYRVIHKSLQDFWTRLRNNQDRRGRREHINR